ncbi:hypothetical protein DVH24_001571, partial [Malus domestica]
AFWKLTGFGFRRNSEVKRVRARAILGYVTHWEVLLANKTVRAWSGPKKTILCYGGVEPGMGARARMSSSTPSALNLCPVVTSSNWRVSRPSLHMSNPLIHNLILSREPTPPTKHSHLRYTHFVYVLMLHRPTFCAIQHRRPYCHPIKFSLELQWHMTVTQHAGYTLPLHPFRLYSIYSVFDRLRRANTRCTWFTQIGYVHEVEEFSLIVKGLHKYIGSSSPLVGTSE